MSDQPTSLAIKPTITYPREAQVGKTYLMTIDLQPEENFGWQYDEEEYPIYCTVDSELFTSKPVGEPVVVLHRFGGNYGEARFLLTAVYGGVEDEVRIVLINRWGFAFRTLHMTDIQISRVHQEGDQIDYSDPEPPSLENEQLQGENWQKGHQVAHWDENDSWNTFHDGEPSSLNAVFHQNSDEESEGASESKADISQDEQKKKNSSNQQGLFRSIKSIIMPSQEQQKSSSDQSPSANQRGIDWLWDNYPGWDE